METEFIEKSEKQIEWLLTLLKKGDINHQQFLNMITPVKVVREPTFAELLETA